MPRIGRTHVIGSAAGAPAAGWFGDGSDGDLTVAARQTLKLDVTTDEGQIVKQYNNLTIEAGAVLKPANRCDGMILLVKGDLTLNGTINMDKCCPLIGSLETENANVVHIKLCGSLTGGDGGDAGRGKTYNDSTYAATYFTATPGVGSPGCVFGGGYPGEAQATKIMVGHVQRDLLPELLSRIQLRLLQIAHPPHYMVLERQYTVMTRQIMC